MSPRLRSTLVSGVVLVLVAVVWLLAGNGGDQETDPAPSARDSASSSASDTSPPTTSEPGVPDGSIAVEDLPPEALDTLDLIDAGGPYPYDEDGRTFGNYEGLLPDHERGYYREFTVESPGLSHRGPLRIVAGDAGELYWTTDHYASFERIVR